MKIIIDNDAGGDDAMAILLTLTYEKYYGGGIKLIGLTTCHGNTTEDKVFINNQKVIKVAGRLDIPIYRGATKALVKGDPTYFYYGPSGLGDDGEESPNISPASDKHAALALVELSKTHEGELIVVAIGPMTNIALAISLDSGFLGRLKHLYVAAGQIYSDVHPTPEYNAKSDVEAYHIIMDHATPDKVTIVPFSQIKDSLNIAFDWRVNVFGAISTNTVKALNNYEAESLRKNKIRGLWQSLDPAALAAVIRDDLVDEYKYVKNDIVLCGDNRGINRNNFCTKDEANVRMIYKMKKEEYKQFLLDVFSAEIK